MGIAFDLLGAVVRASARAHWNLLERDLTKPVYDRLYERFRPRGLVLADSEVGAFWVNADARGFAPRILLLRRYEPGVTKVYRAILARGATVVDIGANVGYYTVIGAHAVEAVGRVLAFEPDVHNFDLLLRNLQRAGVANVTALAVALSDRTGQATLFRDYRSASRSTLAPTAVRRPGGSTSVPLSTLDQALADCACSDAIAVVKIDAEGSEARILRGACATLQDSRPRLLMELWPDGLEAHNDSAEDVLLFLMDLGYHIAEVRESGECRDLSKVSEAAIVARARRLDSIDLYCCPRA